MTNNLNSEDILKIFKDTGALLEGHFILTSGFHSPQYFQCAKVLQYPEYNQLLSSAIAGKFRDNNIDVVITPAVGGIVLGTEVGRQLNARTIFAERENGVMKLRRFPKPGPIRFVVVEDVITTGGSALEVGNLIQAMGAHWVGTGCIVDRSAGKATFPHPLHSLWQAAFPTYAAEECPLCREGIPIEKPGSR